MTQSFVGEGVGQVPGSRRLQSTAPGLVTNSIQFSVSFSQSRICTRIMISKGMVSKGQYSKIVTVKGFQYSF